MAGYEKKRKPPHKNGYTGILLEPMLPEIASGVGWKTKGADARLERMKALLRHYGIKYHFEDGVPDKLALFAFMDLSMKLAQDHVPGFQYRGENRGRKKKAFDARGLFWAVEDLRKKRCSIAEASRKLARKPQWRNHNPATLSRQYKRIRHLLEDDSASALMKLYYEMEPDALDECNRLLDALPLAQSRELPAIGPFSLFGDNAHDSEKTGQK